MKKKSVIGIFIVLFSAGLIYFASSNAQNPPQKQPLTIILSPHFDDAVLSLGGLMAKHGNQILVATFFGGKPSVNMRTDWDIRSGFSDSDEAAAIRAAEDQSALLPFGVTVKHYGYLDFQYDENRSEERNWEIRENIARDIESIIGENRGRQIYVYGPAALEPEAVHKDHQALYDAFLTVTKKDKQPGVQFFNYEDFASLYEFVKTGKGGTGGYPGNSGVRTIIGLTESELGEKIKAVEAYESQAAAFKSNGDDIGLLTEEFYRQRCKNIAPAAYACEVVYGEK